MTLLDDLVNLCSKEIKEEENNIRQIILTLFSAYTKNPQNTRILAPSGEGKTYLVLNVAKLFPQENIIILGKATPQSLKYNLDSKRVVENGHGNWQEYDVAIGPLKEELEKTKDKEKLQELKKQIRELEDSACDYVDFSNKTLIFVDSQSFELFESLKPTMSHDQENIKSFSVNKSKSGTMRGQKFIFHGFPAIIYCSAKDEIVKDETNEINTRFNTISLNASRIKYRKMLDYEAISSSLPHSIRQEEIISDEEIEALRQDIQEMIKQIPDRGEIINPFGEGLSKLFNDDAGSRTRQLKILNNNIKMHTLVNVRHRPRITYEGITTPIAIRLDVEESCKLTKETREIQPYKIKYFNDHIRKAIIEIGKEKQPVAGPIKCLTASEIADYITKKGIIVDRQRLQETYLKHLVSHGFLEEFIDLDNISRHVFGLSTPYLEKEATIESTLVDTSLLDVSCVDSFLCKYLQQRFDSGKLEIFDENNNKIDLQQLAYILKQIVTDTPENRHENGIVEASRSNDGEIS